MRSYTLVQAKTPVYICLISHFWPMKFGSCIIRNTASPRIFIQDPESAAYWCREFNCTQELLTYCVMKVGNSSSAVEDFLYMNKDVFDRFFSQIWEDFRKN